MASEKDIFFAALEKPTLAERAAYVEGACGPDEALRRRVQLLLDNHFAEDDFMATAAVQPAPTVQITSALAEGPGTVIGRYKLLEKIGEGGFGSVYVAEQREPVKRRVALKIIKLGMDTRQVVARFEAERQALALMDHPHIAKVFDAGATDTGRPYFVMELVRGISLTNYCEQEKLGTEDRLQLFIQVCHAIQHAHQKGIIHRDIKPSNILITLHDGVAVPKVIDFGIAKATQQELTEKTVYTQLQQFIGTPAYMSPEQAEMSGFDIDTRSDIYSLGVLLYEMLTGSTPFDTQELLKSGLDEMRKIIKEREPVRPSTRLRQTARLTLPRTQFSILNCQLTNDLDWIVMKCLEKDRRRRYETANALAEDIEKHLNHELVAARPPSMSYRARKFVGRNRVIVGAVGAVAAVLVLGTTVSIWQAVRATRAKREEIQARQTAVAARAVAEEESERARKACEELRLRAYASEMRSAQIALEEGNLGYCRELLRRYIPLPGQVDVRGFEWRYLWSESRGDSSDEFRHDSPVCEAIQSSDGRTLITQCLDGRVRVWDVARHAIIRELPSVNTSGPSNRKTAISGNGTLLSLCTSSEVLVVDTTSWTTSYRFPPALYAPFSADSTELVLLDRDKLTFCNLKTGTSLSVLPQLSKTSTQGIVFSPDGRLMFLGHRWLEAIEVWDLPNHSPAGVLAQAGQCAGMAVSPDSRWLAAGSWDGTMRLWALPEFTPGPAQRVHSSLVFCVAFSPDSRLIATGGEDQLIKIWRVSSSLSTANPLLLEDTLKGHGNEIWDLRFSADGTHLISTSKDESARLWPLSREHRKPVLFELSSSDRNISALSSRHGQYWSVRPDRTVKGTSFRTGVPNPASPPALEPRTLWVSGEGIPYLRGDGVVYGCATNGELVVWDLFSGQAQSLLRHPPSPYVLGVVTNRGRAFVLVRNTTQGTTEAWLKGSTQACSEPWTRPLANLFEGCPCAQSSDGKLVAGAEPGGPIKVVTLDDPPLVRTLVGHKMHICTVAFSPDSRWLASASWDSTARIWDLASSECVQCLRNHRSGVGFVQISPDGRTLITSAGGEPVRFWNMRTGQEMLSLAGHLIVAWPAISPWVVPPESDDGLLLSSPDSTQGRFIPVPSLRAIDAQIQQDLGQRL